MEEKKDYYADKAQDFEENVKKGRNVNEIANAILKEINYTNKEHVMDFGSGTGLLTQEIAPYVKKITAIDMSKAMIDVLKEKTFPCEIDILKVDITDNDYVTKFDSIISSMTIHHIEDVKKIFQKFHALLKEGGTIAISDLESEDGSFHTSDTGVYHLGFDKEEFLQTAKSAGFKNLKIQTISIANKPHGNYPIFLLTGNK